jgi:ribosomal protein L37AE/L43A
VSATREHSDAWVCTDCYMTHTNGASEHDGQWFVDGSDTPTDREPLARFGDSEVADNTCSNHSVVDVYDADGDRTGDTTACPHCEHDGHENGIDDFSWRSCEGCGSTLGGARYRLAVWS